MTIYARLEAQDAAIAQIRDQVAGLLHPTTGAASIEQVNAVEVKVDDIREELGPTPAPVDAPVDPAV